MLSLRHTVDGSYVLEFALLAGPEEDLQLDPVVWPTSMTITGRFRGPADGSFTGPLLGSPGAVLTLVPEAAPTP